MSRLTIVQSVPSIRQKLNITFISTQKQNIRKMSLSISSSSIQLLLLLLLFMILGSTSGASVFRMRQRLQQDDQEDLQVNP